MATRERTAKSKIQAENVGKEVGREEDGGEESHRQEVVQA